jgi:four helix bundle protein
MNEGGEIKTFRDLIVWQKAHDMDLRAIELVTSFPSAQVFWVIGDQLLRASTSISANIIA